jgi:hypothetical protein
MQLLPNRINVASQHLGEQSKENATRFSAQIEAALKEPFFAISSIPIGAGVMVIALLLTVDLITAHC